MTKRMTAASVPLAPAQTTATAASGSRRLETLLITVGSHVILAAFTIVIIYPVVWMLFASFKSNSEIVTNVWGLPQTLHWENYTGAWESGKLGYALLNSILVSVGTVLLVIVFAAPAGFAFAKFSFRFALALFLLFVFTMHAPAPVIPLYVMLVRLGLTDSRLGLILPMVAGGIPLAIFIFRAYFQSMPRELLDAAKVDGCTELLAFLRVVMPISGPAVATVAILQFVGAWNEYFLALILVRSAEMRTIPLAIQVFFYAWGRTEWEQVFAALSIGSLPMILLYIIMQRHFIQGLTAGSVKG
ncbi:MAG: carbohydrate ABC transporter permease [Caldilineaceae bacterium]|nr:carbohydrate ABC transporter permease [Caldilineaceae bacterium]